MPPLIAALMLLAFPAAVICAAITDATSYIIPNRLSAALAVAFLPAALAAGLPLQSFALCAGLGLAALAAGIGVPAVPEILAPLPETLRAVFASGITTGGLTALALNALLPRQAQ